MRLIDADKLMENKFKNDISYNAFCNLVKRQPSIDAVPAVRCKDCKHLHLEKGTWTCVFALPSGPDGYCSYGER